MKSKILNINQVKLTADKLKKQKKTIVVAGGIFDILHTGHLKFLEKSKRYGDKFFILLEEDIKASKKGKNRPVNSQKIRAAILSSLESVDYVIMLKNMTNNKSYDNILIDLKPDVITVTNGDPNIDKKKKQAELIGANVKIAVKRIGNYSTTKYLKNI
jgi:rfaE bifunctional protein nucleotidyltransferase chain/domain